jgi:hypothetical protein
MPSYLAVNLNGSLRQTGGQASTTTMLGSSAVSASSYANQAPVMSVYGSAPRVQARAGGRPLTGGLGGGGLGDSWLNWLDDKYGGSLGKDGGTKTFTYGEAYQEWLDMCNSWNTGMGPAPTWEDFLAWLQAEDEGYNKGNNYYKFVPIGDIVPLILMALSYLVMMFVRKR